jgi:parallel beta-helix repeat protein
MGSSKPDKEQKNKNPKEQEPKDSAPNAIHLYQPRGNPMENRTRSAPRHLELWVGPDQGDLRGDDDKTLQAAADYLHRLGGGTLCLHPGEYTMNNALYLHPGMTLRGNGDATVLKKSPSITTSLRRDADWYENQVEVEDPKGFFPGCGIMLRAWRNGVMEVVRDTVVGVDGPLLSLSRRLGKNFWLEDKACAATLFPILTAAEGVDDVRVEDLVLDGNRRANDEINGNYAGAVFIQRCHRFHFTRVTARDYNGDGFSFQVCDDVHFDACHALDNANLGFHPGSGSQRPIFRGCLARGNTQGIFFCWGVTDGLAEDCDCSGNDYGVTIGHRDTDNTLRNCTLSNNARAGLLFRPPLSEFRGAHRNRIESCLLRDNGHGEDGVGLEISTQTHGIQIHRCRFEDTGQGQQRIGIRLHPGCHDTDLQDNSFTAVPTPVETLPPENLS